MEQSHPNSKDNTDLENYQWNKLKLFQEFKNKKPLELKKHGVEVWFI